MGCHRGDKEAHMRRLIAIAVGVAALAFASAAGAALVPGVYDPGNTGCPGKCPAYAG